MDQTFQLPELIETFLATALPRMRSEPALAGVAAAGSFIEKRLDPYSDIDLVLVAEDAAYAELFERRFQFAEELGDLVNAFIGEHVGEPRLLICLYGDHPLHVDLKFVIFLAWMAWRRPPKACFFIKSNGGGTGLLVCVREGSTLASHHG